MQEPINTLYIIIEPINKLLTTSSFFLKVMQESAHTALGWIKSNTAELCRRSVRPSRTGGGNGSGGGKGGKGGEGRGRGERGANTRGGGLVGGDEEEMEIYLSRSDLHIHFPAAAIPKDGPSAGKKKREEGRGVRDGRERGVREEERGVREGMREG